MLVDHVGIVLGIGYNIGHIFVLPWQTFTKILPLLWDMVFGHKHVSMYKLRRLVFWEMERFVRSLMWTTITSGLLVTVPHHFFALQWIVMKVICLFCVLEMRHIQSQYGWQELCPNQILQLPALIFDKFKCSTTDQRNEMKMWYKP